MKSGPEEILELGLGFWASKTLLSAVELGVFSELAEGALTRDEIGERLGLHPRGRRDFLDALVALGMLTRDGEEYANTVERLRQFLHAMTGLSLGASREIAKRFPFADYNTVLDVGCAEGGLLVELALANPHLRGIGFDLPAAREAYDDYVHSFGLGERLAFCGGDFFRDALPDADVVTLGHILHDWSLNEKMRLLRKAHDAVPKGGAVIVFETIIDDDRRENAFGLLMSLNMLIETPDGFDYTGADCQQWMREIGFTETRVELLIGPDSMVVGTK
jgi:SAM-dependent methyltransferase